MQSPIKKPYSVQCPIILSCQGSKVTSSYCIEVDLVEKITITILRMPQVPKEWLDYTTFNSPVDRILPIKTPLKSSYNTGMSRADMDRARIRNGLSTEEEFTPTQLMRKITERGLPQIGLVIDLTNTQNPTKYYDPQEFKQKDIEHHKLPSGGHELPSEEVYRQFAGYLKHFLTDASKSGQLAAVHCTHGVNRTGYLICRYLMEESGWDVERAIEAYGKARGHCIQRDNYLQDLRRRKPSRR